ncbi:hypothetical protein ATL39_0754 [Sinobaca qinghaiensis]|uniref:DUF8042 domain-containing protein n=1 Tax=Sinobaca qinghaiensis TaxID=342944 RepID=A0A419V8W4_9BACL|nr:hypothetical protein [Sinobaca qinghaiensis]RKD76535.1 hypothetical protein ATL39_0754 [Sinobaca qinghaiensis]
MAKSLEKAELDFLATYSALLDTLEDGFSSVAYFYREGFEESGDRLLLQMLESVLPYSPENMTMAHIVSERGEHQKVLKQFYQTTAEAGKMLETKNRHEKITYLSTVLLPVFQRWKLLVDGLLHQKEN